MRERRAEVWTRMGGQPLKMGSLYVTDSDSRFTYEAGYRDTGLPGLGLVFAPAFFGDDTIRRPRTPAFDFPPPIQALIPPHAERNFQRQLVLQYLAKINIRPETPFEQDWQILVRSGHGGIGHIDVFESDAAAVEWYSSPPKKVLYRVDDQFGFSLKEFMTWFDQDASALIELIGPTPSVGGAIPKLLLSIPRTGWDGHIGLPTRFGDTRLTDILLKFEQPQAYPGIVELEALALDIHAEAGFEVPRHWQVDIGGVKGLAIERFDRDARCVPLFMESLHSVLASGNPETITTPYSADYDTIARALRNPDIQLVSDRKQAQNYLLQRIVLAMLTGNGDLHMQNLTLLMRNGELAFSPVYDPTPMRAYNIHNMLSSMPFGHYGDYVDGQDEAVGFRQAMLSFIHETGIRKDQALPLIENALAVTRDFPERLARLETLPAPYRDQLAGIHMDVRNRFTDLF
jgi:serine/threonine-protein kinase HipA